MSSCTEITALVLTLLLGGCSLSIEQEEIEKATKLCAPHGGLAWISTNKRKAMCKDQVLVDYTWSK